MSATPRTLRSGRYVLHPVRSGGRLSCTDTLLQVERAVRLAPADAAEGVLHGARIAARLRGRAVVNICDIGEAGGVLWLVEDDLEAMSLEEVVAEAGAVKADVLLPAMADVFDALEQAHALGIRHRGLKPGCVSLEWGRGRLKGFQWATGPDGLLPPFLPEVGPWTAPELQRDPAAAAEAVDQFGMASVLLAGLTGRLDGRFSAIHDEDPLWASLPDGLGAVLRRATRRAPERRYDDLSAFREALDEAGPTPVGEATDAKGLFLAGLLRHYKVLSDALDNAEIDEEARRVAHQLRGSGTTFGHPDITRAAAAMARGESLAALRVLVMAVERGLRTPAREPQVLLVEDDPALRTLVLQELRIPSIQARCANSASAARSVLSQDPVDVVILDLGLPDADGLGFLAEVRRSWPDAMVVAVTAADDPELDGKVREAGAERLLRKPIPPHGVARVVREVLALRGQRDGSPISEVVVVEDDPAQARILERILSSANVRPRTYGTGREALDHTGPTPALYILDLGLPDMDGLTLMRELRLDPSRASVPILVLSARDDAVDVVGALERGADDYVAKPYIPAELLARVRRLMRPTRSEV